ncbi:hypothetical protein IB286_01920 [Spongiibacter sp. KMU-158]|uniref:LPP20 lipoprotein n=1 Tax=Spongiibacter pelagi TaxID=2760804 RepID=A0A927GUM4_9GAMM|nr:hypothetical protein [Spongiibacter pelagi]MBD2857746.1 hypothetical protein [Spongiibacter pelagi]
MKNKLMILAAASVLAACGSTPEQPAQQEPASLSGLPSWVLNPYVEDGFASTQCVPFSGNMSIDRQLTLANARTDLAQQLEVKVAAMDETFRERTDVTGGVATGATFSSTSKQFTEQALYGTRPEKVDFVEINGTNNLCSMVTMGREKTLGLFENILDASARQVDPDTKAVLQQQFRGEQGQARLEAERNR